MNTTFEQILGMEREVMIANAVIAFRTAGVPLFVMERQARSAAAAKARLFAALDALTPAEMAAFGEYRQAARA